MSRVHVHVGPEPLNQALLDLAQQLRVSFGGDVAACGQGLRGLEGEHTAEAAFALMTRDTGCRIDRVDSRTFLARRRPVQDPVSPLKPRTSARVTATGETAAVSEVVVAAGRQALELATYAGSRTILGGAELGGAGRRDVGALGLDTAQIASTNLGPGRDKLFLRGLSDGAFTGVSASTVSVYLDDLPVSYNAPDPDLRLADVDRVEVLAGPQGALFGAGSVGGVVRIVPHAPKLNAPEGEAQAALVSTAHGGEGSDVEGAFNLPLLSDRLAVRVVGYREQAPGYIDEPSLAVRDANSVVRLGGRLGALLRIAPEWSATATVVYQDIDSAGAQYVTPGDGPLRDLSHVRTPQDNDFGLISAGLQGPLSFAKLRLSAAYVRHTTDTLYDATDALAAFETSASGPAVYDEAHRRRLAFGEAVLTSPSPSRLGWSAGLFLAHSTDNARAELGAAAALQAFREDRTDQVDEAALFGEAAYRASASLTLRAGLRVFRSTLTTTALEQAPASTTRSSFEGDATTTDASPKVQLEWSATPHLFTYLSFATGYRPAEFNTAAPPGTTFGGVAGELRRVQPDAVRSYEAGLRWSPTGGGRVAASVFYTDWLNVQSEQFNGFGLPMIRNVGDAAVPGLEVSGAWPLAGGWSTSGTLLVDAPRRTSSVSDVLTEAALPGVSSRSATLGLAWRGRVAGISASADLRARYVGAARLDLLAGAPGRMGPRVENTAEIALARNGWALSLTVQNLTDAHPDTFAFGDPFLPANRRQLTPETPRTLTLSLRRAF